MKGYIREYPMFSLCGLNCGLCPIHNMKNGCPGCGGGDGHQSCKIVKCAIEHSRPEYCFMCVNFPCEKYKGIADFDSFVPRRNIFADIQKAKDKGVENYINELSEKIEALNELLENYNDGRKKSFYCTAINLLKLEDIKNTMKRLKENNYDTIKDRAAAAVKLFQIIADERNISLKLKKK